MPNREEACYQKVDKRCLFTPNIGTGKDGRRLYVFANGTSTREKVQPVVKPMVSQVDGETISRRAYKTLRKVAKIMRRKQRKTK